ncbi:MAG: hypothetical protein QGG54_02280, partial [Gammaproteobacteria bacterium]|nr:hypothetical protein [Gammaproteobacteria bacterium]
TRRTSCVIACGIVMNACYRSLPYCIRGAIEADLAIQNIRIAVGGEALYVHDNLVAACSQLIKQY